MPGIFNVTAYGALGNGSHDDTTEIQAAINAAIAAGGGVVYFPASVGGSAFYKVTAALVFTSAVNNRPVWLLGGAPGIDINGAKIWGSVAGGWIIDHHPDSTGTQVLRGIFGLTIINSSTTAAGAVRYNHAQTGIVEQCTIQSYAGFGLFSDLNSYNLNIRNCRITGHNHVGVGLQVTQTNIVFNSIDGWDIGIRSRNVETVIIGNRLESMNIAIQLGVNTDGTYDSLAGAIVQGNQTERVLSALEMISVSNGNVSGNTWTGTIGPAHAITTMSWSGGTMTVTSETPLANWSTWVGGGTLAWTTWTSGTRLVKIESVSDLTPPGFVTAAFVTATRTGTNTFTYAASDPGTSFAGATTWSFKPQFGTRVRTANACTIGANGHNISNLEHCGIDLYHDGNVSALEVVMQGVQGGSWNMPPSNQKASFKYINCDNPTGSTTDARGATAGMVFADLPGQAGVQLSTAREGMEYDILNDNSAGSFGATSSGGGSRHAKVRYNGSNWTVCGA